ncbi:MAG: D-alanyl-D-alanine carboxypeptidase/D-alanyl-D-alanine-endopeptidase [Propionibacteriaceae bacterium]|nr:D-alanyl-D-alanine carboxypeptidase/D-alanyl-D-alanine-endopeptidase [Propionibacteriaceae bacterium]
MARTQGIISLVTGIALSLGVLTAPSAQANDPIVPDGPTLAAQLATVSASKLTTAYAVLDRDGNVLAANDVPSVPASAMKVLTAMAAIDVLGADKTFTTSVLSKREKVTLVAGGDPYLTGSKSSSYAKPANLDALVKATVAKLKSQGIKKIKLRYEANLFSGSSYSSSWSKSWSSYTPRIESLMVNGGMTGSKAEKYPAKATAKLFASKLKKKGIKVTSIKYANRYKGSELVAQATSAPLGQIVRWTLKYSNNVAAEVIARHTALAMGLPGSFAGASTAITTWLQNKGLWANGMKIDGGCGLSSKTKIVPSALARTLKLMLDDPKYVDVSEGLPIARVDGTLSSRFNDKEEYAGRYVVHAKTGTLAKVNALAGYVTTAEGARLTFAFFASHDGKRSGTATNWLDRSASLLATCGCRPMAMYAGVNAPTP